MNSVAPLKVRPHPRAQRQLPHDLRGRPGCHDRGRRRAAARRKGPRDPRGAIVQHLQRATTIRTTSTTSAASRFRAKPTFQSSITTPPTWTAAPKIPPTPEKTTRVLTIMRADEY